MLYIIFLAALELKQELWGLAIVAAGFMVLARRVILSVDWTLLLVFMAMFIDVHFADAASGPCRDNPPDWRTFSAGTLADRHWPVAVYQ